MAHELGSDGKTVVKQSPADVSVYIPTPFRGLTGGLGKVTVNAADVAGVISALEDRFPGIRERLCEGDAVRHYVNVFINGEEMRSLRGERTPLKPGDEVAFVPMLMGG